MTEVVPNKLVTVSPETYSAYQRMQTLIDQGKSTDEIEKAIKVFLAAAQTYEGIDRMRQMVEQGNFFDKGKKGADGQYEPNSESEHTTPPDMQIYIQDYDTKIAQRRNAENEAAISGAKAGVAVQLNAADLKEHQATAAIKAAEAGVAVPMNAAKLREQQARAVTAEQEIRKNQQGIDLTDSVTEEFKGGTLHAGTGKGAVARALGDKWLEKLDSW